MTCQTMVNMLPDKINSLIDRKTPNGCWQWRGGITPTGYAYLYYKGKTYRAHSFIYKWLGKETKDGLVFDHLCRNRACVNPEHLEQVTNRENILRGVGISAQNAKKTHCKRGHPLIPENIDLVLFKKSGVRSCKKCKRIIEREMRARKRSHLLSIINAGVK